MWMYVIIFVIKTTLNGHPALWLDTVIPASVFFSTYELSDLTVLFAVMISDPQIIRVIAKEYVGQRDGCLIGT